MNRKRNTKTGLNHNSKLCLYTMRLQKQFLQFQIQVIVLYRDKSLYIWDIANIHRVGKYRSYLFHSACVCAIEVCVSSTALFLLCLATESEFRLSLQFSSKLLLEDV